MSENELVKSINQHFKWVNYKDSIELYEDRVLWTWNSGNDSGKISFLFDALSPELGYQKGRHQDYYSYRNYGLILLGIAIFIGFSSNISVLFSLAILVGLVGLYFFAWSTMISTPQNWDIVTNSNGSPVIWISHEAVSEKDRIDFKETYEQLFKENKKRD